LEQVQEPPEQAKPGWHSVWFTQAPAELHFCGTPVLLH
jgi:hypothetical protein